MREGISYHLALKRARLYLEQQTPSKASATRHHLVCEQHPRRGRGLGCRSLLSGQGVVTVPERINSATLGTQ
jgi:hypothetical protein